MFPQLEAPGLLIVQLSLRGILSFQALRLEPYRLNSFRARAIQRNSRQSAQGQSAQKCCLLGTGTKMKLKENVFWVKTFIERGTYFFSARWRGGVRLLIVQPALRRAFNWGNTVIENNLLCFAVSRIPRFGFLWKNNKDALKICRCSKSNKLWRFDSAYSSQATQAT